MGLGSFGFHQLGRTSISPTCTPHLTTYHSLPPTHYRLYINTISSIDRYRLRGKKRLTSFLIPTAIAMSELQRNALRATMALHPPLGTEDFPEEDEDEGDDGDDLPIPDNDHDSASSNSSTSSASSTGTIIPSSNRKLFARPQG